MRRNPVSGSAAEILRLIREQRARSRADLVAMTGIARSTVSQRVEALLARGLLYEAGDGPSTGGRPPVVLAFNPRAGVVLAADLGATHSHIALTDLAGTPLAESQQDMDITDGPEQVLAEVDRVFLRLLGDAGAAVSEVVGVGIGVPGPVEFATGRAVDPPIMPGWDGVRIPQPFEQRYGPAVPVLVDNDVNVMAAGEHWAGWRSVDDLLFVKVGTGIGSGIVAGGRIHRGAQGAAGDLGHVQLPDPVSAQFTGGSPPLCHCGRVGCVEAVAGGAALARALRRRGRDATDARDVVRLVGSGDPEAIALVRAAGRAVGEVLATAVSLLNPAVIVVGGDVAQADEPLLAGIREVVRSRSLRLATHHLQVVGTALGGRAGVTGAAAMVIEHILSAEILDAALAAEARTHGGDRTGVGVPNAAPAVTALA